MGREVEGMPLRAKTNRGRPKDQLCVIQARYGSSLCEKYPTKCSVVELFSLLRGT
jgi:hypothetical protein